VFGVNKKFMQKLLFLFGKGSMAEPGPMHFPGKKSVCVGGGARVCILIRFVH
jgi:hypothetical protein